jgi:hypothetical protein
VRDFEYLKKKEREREKERKSRIQQNVFFNYYFEDSKNIFVRTETKQILKQQ